MPTARELLEQADALMRRNRASVDDDIPVLTDAVPSAQESRSRFAPPLLRPVEAPTSAPDIRDDVPLPIDGLDEIEAEATDAAVNEGEPSVWLDFQDAEPSVIGDAPDSISMIPPVDLQRSPPGPEVGAVDSLDDEVAAAIAASPLAVEIAEFDAPDDEADAAVAAPPPATEVAEIDALDEAAAVIAAAPPEAESAWPSAVAMPAPEPGTDSPPQAELPAFEGIAGGAAALLYAETIAPTVVAVAPAHVTLPAQASPALPAPAPAVPDATHWEAMAEEIRMQVLQRIDLFTDTGLRTQLGARLQPIVDRASADLVATINQHVGELLREYVAEAIEREIDNWRRDH